MRKICRLVIAIGLLVHFVYGLECPAGYTLNNGVCYDFRNTATTLRLPCESYCTSTGAMMLCIENVGQQNYVYSHISSFNSIWLGLHLSGSWTWQAGCSSTYFNWSSGEGTQNQAYALLYSSFGGMWADVDVDLAQATACFCQRLPFESPTSQPSTSPSTRPSGQPTTQPSSQPSSRPTTQPTVQPSGQPSLQPSVQPSSLAMLTSLSSKSYKVQNGFSFAARTSSGAVLYWAGDGTMVVHSVVAGGSIAVAVNRAAAAALTAAGYVEVAGIPAYARGYQAYQSGGVALVSLVENEGAFAGITSAGAAAAFGGNGNGNNITATGFATHLSSGVLQIMPSAGSFTALKSDGTVFTWGNKYCGGGVSSLTRADLQGIVKVFASRTAFAGLTSAGKVLTWGDATDGGDSSTVLAQLQSGVYHIVSTRTAFVAFKEDGSIVVWGNPWFGADASAVAAQISSGVMFVAHTSTAFAVVKSDGSVVTWGLENSGGDSSVVQAALVGIVTVVSNLYAFAAITNTGGVVAWGDASEGGEIPVDLVAALSSGVTEVFSTNRAFAAWKGATGELVLWGNPYHGGDAGAAAAYLSSGVRTVCGNDAAFTAILQDGRAVAWGHSTAIPLSGLLISQGDFSEVHECA